MNRPNVWIAMTVLAVAAAAAAPAATAQVNPPPVQWGACPAPPPGLPEAGMQCGTVTVPLDYSHPDGGTIDIAVSIIRAANPATRHGVLLVNPGGPGGAGIQIPRVLTTLWPQSVFATYDVVGFDPRGVDLSAPVTCGLTSAQSHRIFPTLQEAGGFDATVTFAQSIANACADSAGATLPFINTANTARDMDVIRQALGESSISYFAFSYGSYLGAVYASLYPNRADRFVLDSNVNPSWVWRQQYLNWGPGGQVRWPDFASYAAANNATYGFGSTPAQVTATFQRLVTELDATPIPMPALFSDGTIVDGELFRELTFGELEADEDFPTLALIWNLAIQGLGGSAATGAPLQSATPGLDVPPDNQSASGLAVTCNDTAASRIVAQYQAQYAAYGAAYPLFGSLGSNIWPCAFWSTNPIEPPVPIRAAGPSHNILLLQNLRDEATFYPGVLQMHADLGQRSLLVTVDEGGHGIYGFSANTCVTNITTAYLTTGMMPSKDTYCPAQPGATPAAAARAPGMPQQVAARDRARAYLLRQMIPARRALPQ